MDSDIKRASVAAQYVGVGTQIQEEKAAILNRTQSLESNVYQLLDLLSDLSDKLIPVSQEALPTSPANDSAKESPVQIGCSPLYYTLSTIEEAVYNAQRRVRSIRNRLEV